MLLTCLTNEDQQVADANGEEIDRRRNIPHWIAVRSCRSLKSQGSVRVGGLANSLERSVGAGIGKAVLYITGSKSKILIMK